jgi:hypothetical protein
MLEELADLIRPHVTGDCELDSAQSARPDDPVHKRSRVDAPRMERSFRPMQYMYPGLHHLFHHDYQS